MIQERDFRGMKIPPLDDTPDYKKIFKDIPAIAEFSSNKIHKRKIVNYILLMYDPASPFVKRFQNVKKRKVEVADYTGISKLKEEVYQEILRNENSEMVEMIDQYVKFINSRTWSLIVVSESTLWEYQTKILQEIVEDDAKKRLDALNVKNKLLEGIDQISNRLDGYYDRLYSSDKELEDIVKTKMITPEGVAKGHFNADKNTGH